MIRIREVFKDKSGKGFPLILSAILVTFLISTVVFEYMRLMIVAKGVRDAAQYAITDVAAKNWAETYSGLREGYSGAYELSELTWNWQHNVNEINVYERLENLLSLSYEEGSYVKYAGTALEYSISGLALNVLNTPLAPANPLSIAQLNATGTIHLKVPLSFGWEHIPAMEISLRLKSTYVPKF